jgi:hypothetical protein
VKLLGATIWLDELVPMQNSEAGIAPFSIFTAVFDPHGPVTSPAKLVHPPPPPPDAITPQVPDLHPEKLPEDGFHCKADESLQEPDGSVFT